MVDAKSSRASPPPKGPRTFMAYLVEEHIWIFMVFIIPISMVFDVLDFLRLRVNVLLSALGRKKTYFQKKNWNRDKGLLPNIQDQVLAPTRTGLRKFSPKFVDGMSWTWMFRCVQQGQAGSRSLCKNCLTRIGFIRWVLINVDLWRKSFYNYANVTKDQSGCLEVQSNTWCVVAGSISFIGKFQSPFLTATFKEEFLIDTLQAESVGFWCWKQWMLCINLSKSNLSIFLGWDRSG